MGIISKNYESYLKWYERNTMTESDYIIQHLRMDMDKLKAKNSEFEIKVFNLEETLKDEWNCDKIEYCTRCGSPMPEAAYADEANEYCDICASDMGVI